MNPAAQLVIIKQMSRHESCGPAGDYQGDEIVFLPGESHGQRSLVGYSPRDRKESDTTERLNFLSCLHCALLVSGFPLMGGLVN